MNKTIDKLEAQDEELKEIPEIKNIVNQWIADAKKEEQATN